MSLLRSWSGVLCVFIIWVIRTIESAQVAIDWSVGNVVIGEIGVQDDLVLTYNSSYDVYTSSEDADDFKDCVGVAVCGPTESPCIISMLSKAPGDMVYLFSSPQCEAGFKISFQVAGGARNRTDTPTRFPTLPPSNADGSTPSPTMIALDLFVQVDHSASIRDANTECRASTGMKCWKLAAQFVRSLVDTMAKLVGDYERLRLHLSYFSCQPKNFKPTNRVITVPTFASGELAIDAALLKLEMVTETTMYGTCPSYGARQIKNIIRNGNSQPKAYFIITDGKVDAHDQTRFINEMKDIQDLLADPAYGGTEPCALYIGDLPNRSLLSNLTGTSCVEVVPSFSKLAQSTNLAPAFGSKMMRSKNSLAGTSTPSSTPTDTAPTTSTSSTSSVQITAGPTTSPTHEPTTWNGLGKTGSVLASSNHPRPSIGLLLLIVASVVFASCS